MPGSRLANLILACAVAPEDRQHVLGDLAEEYAARREDTSRTSALWWYWTQVVRSIPWLLWIPVCRSGLVATLGVALAACVVQAGIELIAAAMSPLPAHGSARAGGPTLALVLGSLVVVSCVASCVRSGAGTLVTAIASAAVLARFFHAGIDGLHPSDVLASMSAPSAAFIGAALAVNFRRARKLD